MSSRRGASLPRRCATSFLSFTHLSRLPHNHSIGTTTTTSYTRHTSATHQPRVIRIQLVSIIRRRLWGFGECRDLEDLPTQLEPIEINSGEEHVEPEEEEELKEGLSEDQEIGQQGMGNAGSLMSITGTSSSSGSDLGEEPEDELDSNYDPLCD